LKYAVVETGEEIEIIFEGDRALEHVDPTFLRPLYSVFLFFCCALNDRKGEEMLRTVYKMIYADFRCGNIDDSEKMQALM
jgi:hypothetical protein